MSPGLIEEARKRQRRRRRRRLAVAFVIAVSATVVGVFRTTSNVEAAPTQPSIKACIATWDAAVPRPFRSRVIAGGARTAYIAPRIVGADQVPLVHPLCTYSFPLPHGKTLAVSSGVLSGRTVWFAPVALLERLSVATNATLDSGGKLARA